MKCLILAGGFATRLYPLTITKAKALLEYKGTPVINHIVNKIPRTIEILVTTNAKFQADFLNWKENLGRPIEILIEEAVSDGQKKGAVGAIDFWIKKKPITEDIMVLAADNYFDFDLKRLIARFNGRDVLLAVHDVGDKEKACEIGRACQVGLITLEGDRIIRLDEKPQEATSSIIATGIYIIPRRVFPLLSQYCLESKRDNLGDFTNYLLRQGEKVQAFAFSEVWLDIGDEINRGKLAI